MAVDVLSLRRILDENLGELGKLEGNLISAAKGHRLTTLYVTSSRPGEGKTTTAALMAHGLARTSGAQVALVEGSAAAAVFYELFGIDKGSPGLIDYLLSNARLDEVAFPAKYSGLVIIPCSPGVAPHMSLKAFGETVFPTKLAELRERFGYVVFDGAPVFTSSAPTMQARYFDGVVLAVECGKTKWEVVNLARNKLLDAGAHVVGVVLSKRQYAIPASLYAKV